MLPCSLFARSLGAAAFSACRRLLLDFTANVALRIGTTSGMTVRLMCPAQGAFRCRDELECCNRAGYSIPGNRIVSWSELASIAAKLLARVF